MFQIPTDRVDVQEELEFRLQRFGGFDAKETNRLLGFVATKLNVAPEAIHVVAGNRIAKPFHQLATIVPGVFVCSKRGQMTPLFLVGTLDNQRLFHGFFEGKANWNRMSWEID